MKRFFLALLLLSSIGTQSFAVSSPSTSNDAISAIKKLPRVWITAATPCDGGGWSVSGSFSDGEDFEGTFSLACDGVLTVHEAYSVPSDSQLADIKNEIMVQIEIYVRTHKI